MAELPSLPERIQRLHQLRWKKLIEYYGFTGEHLNWHQSESIRRWAALHGLPPRHSSKGGTITYYNPSREEISYRQWKQQQTEAQELRLNDPEVIDHIGVGNSSLLAKARFRSMIVDYFCFWAEVRKNSDEFGLWLEAIVALIENEVGNLWRSSEWHAAWFDRIKGRAVQGALELQVSEWRSRASRLEVRHLEKPHLSTSALLEAEGIECVAKVLQILATAGSVAEDKGDKTIEKMPSGAFENGPFHEGITDYPQLFAFWSSNQNKWSLHDRPLDAEGNYDLNQAIPASFEATNAAKRAARIAIHQLRQSRDPEIRALVTTLQEPLYAWLELLRAKERGYRPIQQITRLSRGQLMAAFVETGAAPTDRKFMVNGTIAPFFVESAAFWEDLAALALEPDATQPSAQLSGDFIHHAQAHDGLMSGNEIHSALRGGDPRMPNVSALASKKRGRRANDQRRVAIHDEIAKYRDAWRDHLSEIFEALHQKDVPLGDFAGREIDLGEGQRQRVNSWEDLDLADGDQRRQILDALRKY